MKTNKFTDIAFLGLILLLCIPVVAAYFNSGYFPTHDGEWAVVRLGDMFRTLKDFQFPPRYSGALNFGYGYPLFNFAYPFPYYLGMIFYLPFKSFILSIKIMFVLSVFLSAIFMYLASNKLWNNKLPAIISSLVYVYLPYRMLDLYVRGSLGESLSFILFPIIFYFSLRLFDSAFSRLTVVVLSICIGILVLTHNIMTILFLPLLLTFILSRIFKEKRFDVLQSFILCIILGAGLSFYFWFPALFEKSNIALSKIPIADRSIYFVNLKNLIIPSWGYAPPTESGGFSYQLGVAQTGVIISALFILLLSFLKNRLLLTPVKFYATVLIIIYFIYLIMMFSITSILWENTPLLSEINYPWTILSQLGFVTALLAGFLAIQGKIQSYIAVFLVLLAIFTTFNYAKPESFNNFPEDHYITNEATTTSSDEYMPLWVKEKPLSHFGDKVEVIGGASKITDIFYKSNQIKFNYKADSDPTFKINTIYYPGWKAYINGVPAEIDYKNPQGVMVIKGTRYGDKVFLQFGETLSRTFANGVSLVSILVLGFILLRPILLFKNEN